MILLWAVPYWLVVLVAVQYDRRLYKKGLLTIGQIMLTLMIVLVAVFVTGMFIWVL